MCPQTVLGDLSALGHLYEELGVAPNPIYSLDPVWVNYKKGLVKTKTEPLQSPALLLVDLLRCVEHNRTLAAELRTSTGEHTLAAALILWLGGLRRMSAAMIWWDPIEPEKSQLTFLWDEETSVWVLRMKVTHQKNHKLCEPMIRHIPDVCWGEVDNGQKFYPIRWLRHYMQHVPPGWALAAPRTIRLKGALQAGWRENPFTAWDALAARFVAPLAGDGKKYTPHSFRRGLYTTAFHAGMSKDDVRKYGNWASDACELYYAMSSQRVYAMFTGMAEVARKERAKAAAKAPRAM